MKRVTWAPSAQRDLRSLITWYQRFDPDLPERFIDDIERAAARLIDCPLLGAPLSDSTDRKWRARETPFILIYRPVRAGVWILRVVHEATDWKPRS